MHARAHLLRRAEGHGRLRAHAAPAAADNWRLNPNSPGFNAGTNQSWMTNALDLDGRIRIRYWVVDMGAYEGIYEGTIYRGF